MKNRHFDKLLWADLEFNGLNFESAELLEAAIIVTDDSYNELESVDLIIKQPESVILSMKNTPLGPSAKTKPEMRGLESVYDLHEKSGLIEELKSATLSSAEAEATALELISRHFAPDETVILAGNSIAADRAVIRASWPKLDARLFYRMLDVSSFKLVLTNAGLPPFEKQSTHRAMDDVRESIAELKYYLSSAER